MKCPRCGINALSTPKEFLNGPACDRGPRCVYLDKNTSSVFCYTRRQFLESIVPMDSIAIATSLAKQFRDEHDWCRPPSNVGNCISASDEFLDVLELEAIRASVQFGSLRKREHAWNEVWCPKEQTMFILDLTADQFESFEEGIVLIKVSDMESLGYKYEL